MYRLLAKIYKDVGEINKRMADKPSTSPWLNVAAIHSTLLALTFAIISAYLFISFINLKELERSVLEESEKINEVQFAHSMYKPNKDEFIPIDSFGVLWDLSVTYSQYLLDSEISPRTIKLDSGSYEIPENPADRVEKFFRLLYYINNRYPLPFESKVEIIENRPIWRPRSLHFEGTKDVENWLKDLNQHLYALQVFQRTFTTFPSRFSKFFNILYEKNELLINMKGINWEGNPTKLLINFFECNIKAQNVYIKTYHQIQRYNKYKASIFSIRTSIIIYAWGILSLFTGILWPIYGKKYNYFISNLVPISFYFAVIFIAGYKMYSFF